MRMLRKATMRGRSGTFAAISGWLLASWPNASPMISNCRSTADRSRMSCLKSSKLLPRVKSAMAPAALRASHRYLRGSRCIDGLAALLDARAEIGVLDRAVHDEIDRPAEECFERFLEAEI